MGKVGDASVFRVWGALSLVHDAKASKLSSRTLRCVFLGFPADAPPWVLLPQPASVDSGAETAGAEHGGTETEGEGSGGAGSGGATTGGAGSWGAVTGGADSRGAASPSGGGAVGYPTGGSPGGGGYGPVGAGAANPGGTAGAGGTGGTAGGAGGAVGAGDTRGAAGGGGAGATSPRGATSAGGAGPTSPRGTAGAGGAGAAGPGGARTGGVRAAGAGGAVRAGGTTGAAGSGGTRGTAGAGAAGAGGTAGAGGARGATRAAGTGGAGGNTGARGPRAAGASGAAGAGGAGGSAGAVGAGGAGATDAGGAGAPDSCFHTCSCSSCHSSTPSAVPGTHGMALRPSSVPQRVVLPEPPASSFPHVLDPESNLARAASPIVTRLLATVDTDPDLESTAAFALVTELVEFAARSHLDSVASLVTESESVFPPSVEGEPALGNDVREDRNLAATLPRFASMLLCPEGDQDALHIPTPCSYAEAIAGEYSSQWQTAMDTEMASWKSTGTYVDQVPPPGANIVDGMWIFRVKRPPGSPPTFKARYAA
ncbi:unnamed protein product [Closterium sp. NIES-54]